MKKYLATLTLLALITSASAQQAFTIRSQSGHGGIEVHGGTCVIRIFAGETVQSDLVVQKVSGNCNPQVIAQFVAGRKRK